MNSLKIKKIRKKFGLTQSDFAKKLGINIRTVQKWEAGDTIPESKCLLIDNKFPLEENTVLEPEAQYIITDKTQLLKIAVEFAENYQRLKEFTIVKNIIEIEVLKRLIEMKQNPNHNV